MSKLKMKIFTQLVITIVMVHFSMVLKAQTIDSLMFHELKEHVNLMTDREVYMVNEDILFAAQVFSNQVDDTKFSKVIYVELIDYLGHSFDRGKFLLNDGFCNAKLNIPPSLKTGTYYLKAYTKWMRNFSNLEYFYTPITIINPLSNEVLAKAEDYKADFALEQIKIPDLNVSINAQSTSKTNTFNLHSNIAGQGNFIVSASKSIALSDSISQLRPLKSIQTPEQIEFLPEIRSLSLSGQLIEKESRTPAKFVKVYLTLLHENNTILNTFSDENGRFQFLLPKVYGNNEILLSVKKNSENAVEILVDNDFCEKPVNLPFVPISFINDRKEELNGLSLTSQINSFYTPIESKNDEVSISYHSNISKEAKTVFMANYILLPKISDYFNEFYPQVHITKSHNDFRIMIDNAVAYSELHIYPPLITIDNIVVTDCNEFLKINTEELERIEVLNRPYLVGDEIYGGVINVYSKKGNWANMNLPADAVIIDYEMYHADNSLLQNLNGTTGLSNTIFWNAYSINSVDNWQVQFENGNNFGNYQLRVLLIDRLGKISKTEFSLKIDASQK